MSRFLLLLPATSILLLEIQELLQAWNLSAATGWIQFWYTTVVTFWAFVAVCQKLKPVQCAYTPTVSIYQWLFPSLCFLPFRGCLVTFFFFYWESVELWFFRVQLLPQSLKKQNLWVGWMGGWIHLVKSIKHTACYFAYCSIQSLFWTIMTLLGQLGFSNVSWTKRTTPSWLLNQYRTSGC